MVRKAWPALAVVAGLALLAFEGRHILAGAGGGERWFWVLVAALVLVLGLTELLAKPRPRR